MTYPVLPDFKELANQITFYAQLQHERGAKGIEPVVRRSERALQTALRQLRQCPPDRKMAAKEPDSLRAIRALRPRGPRKMWMDFEAPEYREKLAGAMLGRFAGCTLGAPVEFWEIKKMQDWAKEIGDVFPPTDYWREIPDRNRLRYRASRCDAYTRAKMDGVPVDDARAVQYYAAAAEKNSSVGQFNLANHYAHGLGLEKSDAEAAKWFQKSAENGFAKAMFNLGVLYRHGRGVPQDDKESFKWFQAGAAHKHPESHYNLAVCYETGRGVERDQKRARTLFMMAAMDGVNLAQFKLGMLYKQGADEFPGNPKNSLTWLQKAAKGGHAEAHFEVGDLYERGDGVPADRLAAARHFQAAAAKGVAKAGERLAILLPNLTDAERAALVASGQ